jgi:hypothetical protein
VDRDDEAWLRREEQPAVRGGGGAERCCLEGRRCAEEGGECRQVDPRVDWGQSDQNPTVPLLFRAEPLPPTG